MRLAVLISVIAGLGCSTLVDLERAREAFRGTEKPTVPILVESRALELPAPRGLRAVSGQLRAIPLKWDPLLTGNVSGYLIERTHKKAGRFRRIGAVPGRFETRYVDRGDDLAPKKGSKGGRADLGDGTSYCYRVRAFDSSGRIAAAPDPEVCATTAWLPAAPSGLQAFSHQPREVALSWHPVPDPTVVGYRVYRNPARQGDYLLVARLDGRFSTTYVDRGLGALRVFHYRVASVNAAGGVGKKASEVRAVTKPEPLSPIGLRVEEQRLGSNHLAWDPNVERDIAGYRLLRIRQGSSPGEIVATLAPDTTIAGDREIGAGERLSYKVVAFDRDGLESDPSDPIEVESVDYGLRALPQEGAIQLQWKPEVQEGFAAARVLREKIFGSDEIARVPSEGFVDRDVKPGHRYRYLVILVREDGSEAPPSTVVEATVPK
jgi:fibronectin type 3 domain-containing protein